MCLYVSLDLAAYIKFIFSVFVFPFIETETNSLWAGTREQSKAATDKTNPELPAKSVAFVHRSGTKCG